MGLPTSALGLWFSPQLNSFSTAPEDAGEFSVRRRVDPSSTSANPILGAHGCLMLPGRRILRLFGVYPSERVAKSANELTERVLSPATSRLPLLISPFFLWVRM